MPHTQGSSPTASTADSSAPEPPPRTDGGGVCAIHQPNLFPRLSTIAKLFTADYWIVLDDVQFNRRDYQHRTRLADLENSAHGRWLTISTHLPYGRSTLISDARIVEPERCQRRISGLIRQLYHHSPYWHEVEDRVHRVTAMFGTTDRTADVAEASTRELLNMLGWNGTILRSSSLQPLHGRSLRLADLADKTQATSYLCGTGGMRYLETQPFDDRGVAVAQFHVPQHGVWTSARSISVLWHLMTYGTARLRAQLHRLAEDRSASDRAR